MPPPKIPLYLRSLPDSISPTIPRLAIFIPSILLIATPILSGIVLLLLRKFSPDRYHKTAPYCPFRRTWAVILPILTTMQRVRYRNRGIRARAKARSKSNGSHGSPEAPVSSLMDSLNSSLSWTWLKTKPKNFSYRNPNDGKWCLFGPWRRSDQYAGHEDDVKKQNCADLSMPHQSTKSACTVAVTQPSILYSSPCRTSVTSDWRTVSVGPSFESSAGQYHSREKHAIGERNNHFPLLGPVVVGKVTSNGIIMRKSMGQSSLRAWWDGLGGG